MVVFKCGDIPAKNTVFRKKQFPKNSTRLKITCISSFVFRDILTRQLTDDCYMVKTGVRQGCLLSSFHFLLAIDCITRTTMWHTRNGTQLTIWSQLGDFDFADGLVRLSQSQQYKENTQLFNTVSVVFQYSS